MNLLRLQQLFESLKQLNKPDEVGYNRIAYTKAEDEAMDWTESIAKQLPVTIVRDTIGNMLITYEGQSNERVAFGSHLDTVKNGGLLDGALGVLAGLECMFSWAESNYKPYKHIDLCIFRAEEANPLGGTFGSRAFAGLIDGIDEKLLTDTAQLTFQNILSARTSYTYDAFVELHIEQGSVLENNQIDLGVVTSISGIIRTQFIFSGEARHAGTTPMHIRKDALVDAARFILFCNEQIKQFENLVCTIGELHMLPNQASIIPNEVVATLEIRGHNIEQMEYFEQLVNEWLAEQKLTPIRKRIITKPPGTMDTHFCQQVDSIIQSLGYSTLLMACGASHDCNSMAKLCPSTMIFIPSVNGISHHPDEYSTWEQIEKGACALKATMEYLANN